MSFIDNELESVRQSCSKEVEGSEVISCFKASVRINIRRTRYKQVVVCLQFSDQYPDTPILLELKSKFLPDKLLDGLTKICEEKLKEQKGKAQILFLLKFIRQFLEDNPFSVCSEELTYIKKHIVSEGDKIVTKSKAGVIVITVNQDNYFMKLRFSIPDAYPSDPVTLENLAHNYPDIFQKMLIAQAQEMARRCVEPPLKRKPRDPPFEPAPSLQKIANFLIRDGLRKLPTDPCQVCKERAFPKEPKNVVNNAEHGRHVEWVYCGHIFHNGCLDEYMKLPPFTGGKKCPGCKKRIYHDKWNISPELAEARWAHHQAREREIDEVTDFLK
ncbi:hypothetical protein BSL78_11136 [Apostichopus japonicus]|uniref:RING-type domain-containing protein n=1 Tax=Stichopus japonicus TaxID=307972 RepID=A0A2G8KVD9_STIJA|nr:hypothetical protein BSL78_11136 [Apostichopus japonicus]